MARVNGYGGLAATNGARSFAGKEEAEILASFRTRSGRYMQARGTRVYREWFAALAFLLNLN